MPTGGSVKSQKQTPAPSVVNSTNQSASLRSENMVRLVLSKYRWYGRPGPGQETAQNQGVALEFFTLGAMAQINP